MMKNKALKGFIGILLIIAAMLAFAYSLWLQSPPSILSSAASAYPKSASPIKQDQLNSYPIPPTPTKETTKAPTTIPTSTPKIDGNGWHIYQDAEAGYSFSYPVGVRLEAFDKGYVYLWFTSLGLSGHFGMEFEYRKNPDKKTTIEIAKKIYVETSQQVAPGDFEAFIHAQDISIGGKPAKKVKIPSIVSDYTILILKGDHVLIINLEHDAVIPSAPPEILKLVDQILTTLRFFD